ncbi:Ppx/GppA phosphatase family protein [Candidatus Methylacidithermus pantelleriae]|uniref:Exopolyphosphatase n=1 Tax=Candidatus Methylacidithermus pantelleriae TaxID=2744239 RepID=A0A8J2FPB8_9BACT|nr:hypothetical protein [Candidatus Methylacidithermus pantelleriae]CAF0701203.1 Exopolyphosphatase [Candidatus Methylacidithermus pantelleriae]
MRLGDLPQEALPALPQELEPCAVYELGSNSFKLVQAFREGADRIWIFADRSLACRLAEGLEKKGELGSDAVQRGLRALESLRSQEQKGIGQRWILATSAVRDAHNREEFLSQVEELLGIRPVVLSGWQEASLILQGVATDPQWTQLALEVVDVGGGSCEWMEGAGGELWAAASLPLGSVRLREAFLKDFPVGPEVVRNLKAFLYERVAKATADFARRAQVLVATGGAVTAAASFREKEVALRLRCGGKVWIPRETLEETLGKLQELSWENLLQETSIEKERADLLIPGLCILSVTLELAGGKGVWISGRGLRYGALARWLGQGARPVVLWKVEKGS